MNNFGELTDSGTIRFECLLPGPIERVWAYLTESEKKEKWLAAIDIDLKVGGKVYLQFHHKNLTEDKDPFPEKYKDLENGACFTGEVTACKPPGLLSYTWSEESGASSEVTYELFPKEDDSVLLLLNHRRLGDNQDQIIGAAAGWHTHLGILADRLAGRAPKAF
ncbi:MAG: SRPBCC family protein [Balneolaceae bacterium]|nr:SRPBCC family protein [Balneolaceae bacterium]